MESINYNLLFKFEEVYKTKEEFKTLIDNVTLAVPSFDVLKLYPVIVNLYKSEGLKYSTFEDVDVDLANIWNEQIYEQNRRFELLSQDYPYLKNSRRLKTILETISDTVAKDITRTGNDVINNTVDRNIDSTEYADPQYDDLIKSPTSKTIAVDGEVSVGGIIKNENIDDDTVRDFDRDVTETDDTTTMTDDEMLKSYFELYQRFNLRVVAEMFAPLFLEVFIIR
jgi:hypothetical protein